MRILISLLILGAFSSKAICQIQEGNLEALQNLKNVSELDNLINSIKSDPSPAAGNLIFKDEIRGRLDKEYDYRLYLLNLVNSSSKAFEIYTDVTTFEVEVLIKNKLIVFSRLSNRFGENIRTEVQKEGIQEFIKAHEKIFNITLNVNLEELVFYEEEEFGWRCYACGQLPEKYLELINYVREKNIYELTILLKSISPLSQSYGVLGLVYLKSKGLLLDKETLSLIKLVRKQTIELRSCFACSVTNYKAPMNALLNKKSLKENFSFLEFMLNEGAIGR